MTQARRMIGTRVPMSAFSVVVRVVLAELEDASGFEVGVGGEAVIVMRYGALSVEVMFVEEVGVGPAVPVVAAVDCIPASTDTDAVADTGTGKGWPGYAHFNPRP